MSRLTKTGLAFPVLAAAFLWMKTYAAYRLNFHLKIEDGLQQFILLINPLSFLLLAFGISFCFRSSKNQIRYIFITHVILSFILYANIVFYRFFTDFITVPVLMQTNNFGELGDSAFSEMKWWDPVYFADTFILLILIKYKRQAFIKSVIFPYSRKAYFILSAAIMLVNLFLAEAVRPELLTRTFDRQILVKNLGIFHYHLYDLALQSKSSAQRVLADEGKLAEIQNYVSANELDVNRDYYGIIKSRNIIVISLESTQNFVLNRKINGAELTPFLNRFIKNSFFFDHFYHQTGQGKTSDAEFLAENSLFPLGRGAVFFTHSGNQYNSLAERLGENGYYTAAMHANNKSFWNRDIMYTSLGYERFYSSGDYLIDGENSTNWGLKDIPFFVQSAEHMAHMKEPFYVKLVTLTNHHPFKIAKEDQWVDGNVTQDKTINRYFTTVRYEDEALKEFIEKLKKSGIYDRSVIIIYGDHYGISENHDRGMKQLLGKDITPVVHTDLQRVPFIVHIPGLTDRGRGRTFHQLGGQIDIRPTLLHLLGIPTKGDLAFGKDLFARSPRRFVIFRDGGFVSEEYIWAANKCFSRSSEIPLNKKNCNALIQKANQELGYSDKIIYGDLLRFSSY